MSDIPKYKNQWNDALLFGSDLPGFDGMVKDFEIKLKRWDGLKNQLELIAALKNFMQDNDILKEKNNNSSISRNRNFIFLSYNHNDRTWVDEIKKTLKPTMRNKPVALWDDSMIKPGEEWRQSIKNALDRSYAAVLFVSRDFLASEFITNMSRHHYSIKRSRKE